MNLADAIESNARRRPDHPAIVRRDGSVLTHGAYGEAVRRWAAALAEEGVQPGDVVGINLGDTPDHLIALYAVPRAGAVILPMDWRWTAEEKQRVAAHFGARTVLSEPEDSPFLAADGGWRNLRIDADWQARVDAASAASRFPEADDPPLVLSLSSGTTGTPKGPMITHRQFHARFMIYFVTLGFSERERYLCATPLYFGGCRGYSMCALYAGGTVLMCPPPADAADLVAFANSHSATRLFLVPTQIRRLLATIGNDDETPLFHSLELLFSTGAVLHAEERGALMARVCPRYLNFYGSTDGGGCSALLWNDPPAVSGSVGRPVFGATLEIVDGNDQPVDAGTVGRIRYRHPGTADGYHNDPSGSREAFRDGWYYPGDLGWLDPDGYLFLAGREKDMIIRGGANVYPAEIEHVLTLHPGVHEAAVVAWPSADLGEDIAAFVVPVDGAPLPEADDLRTWCRERLAPYKTPRDVFRVASLPRSAIGKVLKSDLAARLEPL